MNREILRIAATLILTVPCHSQTQAAFEVASIKPLAPGVDLSGSRPIVDNSTFNLPGTSTFNLVSMAYHIRHESEIEDGPWKDTWVFRDLFSVQAKLPEGATVKQIPEMLRTLLTDRFALGTHSEQKTVQGLALTVGKGGPKFNETRPEPTNPTESASASGLSAIIGEQPHLNQVSGGMRVEHERMTMKMLADRLADFLERPVIDRTGLSGQYNIKLDIPWDAPGELDTSIPSAVQSLGLKLEPTKVPQEVLVIDRVERPTGN
jgi:uncharacterized protein (TIGR03435 family)